MSVALSGPFDTAQLPRIAPQPVTVTISRAIRPGLEAQYLVWAEDAVATVRKFHGCLGAGILQPGPDDGGHQIVFRFVDGVHLRRWERSPERAELVARAAPFVQEERITRTVGVEDWFDLPSRAAPKRGFFQGLVTEVAWAYPLGIGASLVLAPRIAELPTGVRVVISSALITAIVRLAVSPLRTRLRSRRRL